MYMPWKSKEVVEREREREREMRVSKRLQRTKHRVHTLLAEYYFSLSLAKTQPSVPSHRKPLLIRTVSHHVT